MRFEADFTALIDRFSPVPSAPIAIAVSGGSDSTALLTLCRNWTRRSGRTLIAFTVDHRLRDDAREEAERVRALCHDWQIPHQILTWETPKPTQSAARLARYCLIASAMKKVGAACLLTGHTQDDVVETALIRRRRGGRDSAIAGPAPAAPFPIWPEARGLTLLRPLIRMRRTVLRARLQREGQTWIEDPSNQNLAFERVRIRQFLARHPNLAQLAERAVARLQSARIADDVALAAALDHTEVGNDGLIRTQGAVVQARLLAMLTRVASGGVRDPRGPTLTSLKQVLTAPGTRMTLGGAWVQRTDTGYLIGRDPGGTISPPDGEVFDGRFVLDPDAQMPTESEAAFLVRHALPPGLAWRQILSERLLHMQACLRAPLLRLVAE